MNILKILPLLLFIHTISGLSQFQKEELRVKKLLPSLINSFQKKTIGEACSAFTFDKKWKIDPLFIIIGDLQSGGLKLVDQLRPDAVWNKFISSYDILNRPLVETMLTANNPMWINFYRFNKLFHVYCKVVEKDKIKYTVGIGFFPEEKDFIGATLANAVTENIKSSSLLAVSNVVNNIHGRLVIGDVYATIINNKGMCWAHGKNYLLVSQNLLQQNQSDLYSLILKTVNEDKKAKGELDYKNGNAEYKVFFETFRQRPDDAIYIIITQFCKNISLKVIEDMAEKIAKLLQSSDKSIFDKINLFKKTRDSLTTHDLSATILDKKNGIVLAGTDPQFFSQLGKSLFDYYDQKQQPVGQILKQQVQQKNAGYISRFSKNALERIYFLNVDTSYGSFTILITNYFPYAKEELAPILVEDVINYLNRKQNCAAFDFIRDEGGPFMIGDITIKILNKEGFCLINGTNYEAMWTQDKTLAAAPEGWLLDQRTYPVENKYYRKILPHFLGQPDSLIIGASYSQLIH